MMSEYINWVLGCCFWLIVFLGTIFFSYTQIKYQKKFTRHKHDNSYYSDEESNALDDEGVKQELDSNITDSQFEMSPDETPENVYNYIDKLLVNCSNIIEEDSGPKYMKIFVGTWNLANRPVSQSKLRVWLTKEQQVSDHSISEESYEFSKLSYDIIAIGAQECKYSPRVGFESCEDDWFHIVQETVGIEYENIASISIRDSIRLLIFVHCSHKDKVHSVNIGSCITKIPVFWKKGGVGIKFNILDISFCFINCHLSAGPKNVSTRRYEIESIFKYLKLGNSFLDASNQFHHCFFFGDLNYRIDVEKNDMKKFSVVKEFETLLNYDQLYLEQKKGSILTSFTEPPISFAPTFKLIKNTIREYDKKRVPGWCDRILIHSLPNSAISMLQYSDVEELDMSDHKPVFATFMVPLSGTTYSSNEIKDMIKFDKYVLKLSDVSYDIKLSTVILIRPNIKITSLILEENSHVLHLGQDVKSSASEHTLTSISIPRIFLNNQHLFVTLCSFRNAYNEDSIGQAAIPLKKFFGHKQAFTEPLISCGRKIGVIQGQLLVNCKD